MAALWIIDEILAEVKRAKKKHPQWPDHVVARAAIVSEEAGELLRSSLNYKYEATQPLDKARWKADMKDEAIQTAATAIRFLEGLKDIK